MADTYADPNLDDQKTGDQQEIDTEFEFKSFSAKEAAEILAELRILSEDAQAFQPTDNSMVLKAASDRIETNVNAKLNVFQEQPELLDPHLDGIISPLMKIARNIIAKGEFCGHPYLLKVFKIIYVLAKVRGYKTVVKFFPHTVADLEPTLNCLMAQNSKEYETWEVRYSLLLWISIVILIPFDLATVVCN